MRRHSAFVKPFIYKKPSVSEVSIRLIIILLVQILMLAFTKSFSAVIVIASAFLGSMCASALRFLIRRNKMYMTTVSIVQGLMIGMLLPESYPPVAVFFITFSMLFVTEIFFDGFEYTWINISAFTVIMAWFVGSRFFPDFMVTGEILSRKNPSLYLIQNGQFPIYHFDSSVTAFLNTHLFNYFKVSIPEGYMSLLWDSHSAIPAFRFNLLTIAAGIFLFADGAFSPTVSSLFVLTYALLVRLFVPATFGGSFNSGDIILAIFTSGTLFCANFMLQWYGTVPKSNCGRLLYGVIAGVIAYILVGCGTSPIEMVYTVFLCNIINLVISVFEDSWYKNALKKAVCKTV